MHCAVQFTLQIWDSNRVLQFRIASDAAVPHPTTAGLPFVLHSFAPDPTFVTYLSGTRHMREHGAFFKVAGIAASFVPPECPVGRGVLGIFEKPLKRAFWRCMGQRGGGGLEPFFF